MNIIRLCYLLLVLCLAITACTKQITHTPAMARIKIEAFRDKGTGELIQGVTIVVDYEDDEVEEITFEDYKNESIVLEVLTNERKIIRVTAPGYKEWQIGFRFNAPKLMMFPVELERILEDSTLLPLIYPFGI